MTLPPPPFYRFRPHPWHGLDAGLHSPAVVNAYIEITPFDTMKYEIDKSTGYLKVDRPQRGSHCNSVDNRRRRWRPGF